MSSKEILNYYGKLNAGFLHSFGESSTELLIDKLAIKPNEHVLEIGFGTAASLVKIASRFPSAHYYGIERSKLMLEKASKRIGFCFLSKKIQILQTDTIELNPFNIKMDKIYIESVLGIQEDDELKKMILNVRKILAPGGTLIINETIWKDDVSIKEIKEINAKCKQAFGIIQSNSKYYSKTLWGNLFVECGFSVLSMEEINANKNLRERKNWRELLSALFTKLGKLKHIFNGDLQLETKLFNSSMRSIITSDKQIMTGVFFVLNKA